MEYFDLDLEELLLYAYEGVILTHGSCLWEVSFLCPLLKDPFLIVD